ncbi:MAG: hypothetical protein NVSMB30_30420 [Hymenobacter sp.]
MTTAEYRTMLASAEAALKANPKNASALLQRAKAKSYLKQYKEALPDYTAALRYQRANPDIYYNRGVNRLMMKEYKAAATDFSGALKYRPDDKESFFGRGVAKMQMYQYKPAVAVLPAPFSSTRPTPTPGSTVASAIRRLRSCRRPGATWSGPPSSTPKPPKACAATWATKAKSPSSQRHRPAPRPAPP